MAEKIKDKKGLELKVTPRAYEKLKEIVNSSKEKVNEFIKKIINDGIKKEDYKVFLKHLNEKFYYHRCNNVYVIFAIEGKIVTLVDFLTEIEFKEIKNKKV